MTKIKKITAGSAKSGDFAELLKNKNPSHY